MTDQVPAETPAERKVMRSIAARYGRQAAAERREPAAAHAAAHQPAPSRTTWDRTPRAGDVVDRLPQRERQRVEILALGAARPAGRKVGKGRAKRTIPAKLDEGVDRALHLRETYGHKQGTPETYHHVANAHAGALAQLYANATIDAEQLASAVAIAEVVERIGADVTVRTASMETRVDVTRTGDGTFYEALGRVRAEVAYDRWRARVAQLGPVGAVLAMVTGETVGYTVAARQYRIHNRRAKKLLLDALDAWPAILGQVRREISSADLAAAHAGIL